MAYGRRRMLLLAALGMMSSPDFFTAGQQSPVEASNESAYVVIAGVAGVGSASNHPAWSAADAVDGSCSTYYQTDSQIVDQWVSFDVGSSVHVGGIDLYNVHNNQAVANFSVESSSDGASWSHVGDFRASALGDGSFLAACDGQAVERFTFPPAEARYWRLNLLSNRGSDTYITFLEVRFLASRAHQACWGVALGDRFVQLGAWRIGEVGTADGMVADHLSVAHEGGQTAQIFRSDGTLHPGPRGDYTTWGRPIAPPSGISVGDGFIQIGKFRVGAKDERHLSVAHQDGQTVQIFRNDGTLHPGPRTDWSVWDRPFATAISSAEELSCGEDFIQISSAWRIGQTDASDLAVSHEGGWTPQAYRSDGTQTGPREDVSSWGRPFVILGPYDDPAACTAKHEDMLGQDVQRTTYSGTSESEKDQSCCDHCEALATCTFWVRATDTPDCWLKTGFTSHSANSLRRGAKKVRRAYDDPVFGTVQVLELAAHGFDLKEGFAGTFTDGTYGYVIPYTSGTVARFDLANFTTVQALDLTSTIPRTRENLRGFHGGFADGTYGYAIPHYNAAAGFHIGLVARFDLANFATVQVLDLAAFDTQLGGFQGGFTDGIYGYAMPLHNGRAGGNFGKLVRFDLAGFTTVQVLDLSRSDSDLKAFCGGFSDGTYGYAIPRGNRKLARFDLAGFTTFQVLDLSFDSDLTGFMYGFTDGTYGYLTSGANGKLARVDLAGFTTVQVLSLAAVGFSAAYGGGFADGTYGYVTSSWQTPGKVARFDLEGFTSVQVLDLAALEADLTGIFGGFTDGTYGYVPLRANGAVARFAVAEATTKTPTTTTTRTLTPTSATATTTTSITVTSMTTATSVTVTTVTETETQTTVDIGVERCFDFQIFHALTKQCRDCPEGQNPDADQKTCEDERSLGLTELEWIAVAALGTVVLGLLGLLGYRLNKIYKCCKGLCRTARPTNEPPAEPTAAPANQIAAAGVEPPTAV